MSQVSHGFPALRARPYAAYVRAATACDRSAAPSQDAGDYARNPQRR